MLRQCSEVALGISLGIWLASTSRSWRRLTPFWHAFMLWLGAVGKWCACGWLVINWPWDREGLESKDNSNTQQAGPTWVRGSVHSGMQYSGGTEKGSSKASPGWMGGGAKTVGGFNGAHSLKNISKTWFGFDFFAFTPCLACSQHAFNAWWVSRFLYPPVLTWTNLWQSGHSSLLKLVNLTATTFLSLLTPSLDYIVLEFNTVSYFRLGSSSQLSSWSFHIMAGIAESIDKQSNKSRSKSRFTFILLSELTVKCCRAQWIIYELCYGQ